MSKSMNRVFLMGHIGHKPEMRTSKEGKPFARLRLATARYRGPDLPETTDWHSVFVYGNEADACVKYLEKGAMVFVEGNIRYWDNGEEDKNRYQQAITADQIRFITYSGRASLENVDNSGVARNHNAVAHL